MAHEVAISLSLSVYSFGSLDHDFILTRVVTTVYCSRNSRVKFVIAVYYNIVEMVNISLV